MDVIGIEDIHSLAVLYGADATPVERHAANALAAHFRDTFQLGPRPTAFAGSMASLPDASGLFLLGTVNSLAALGPLAEAGSLDIPREPEGFALRRLPHPLRPDGWLIMVAGRDPEGVLWGVRDLCHHHLSVEGDPAYDPERGQGLRDVFGGRRIALPGTLDVRDWPRVRHRAYWAYGQELNLEPPNAHGYVAYNPYRWVENMSRWKANVLLLWEGDHSLLSAEPELIDYAHSRGVRIVVGIGLYSYYTEVAAPAHLKRTPHRHRIPDGQLWATDRGLCPSDPENRAWMIEYTLDYIRRYRPDGVIFQTGEVDYRPCECESCRAVPMDELFLNTVQPLVEAVRREFGESFWIISNQLHRPQYYETLSRLDPSVTFLWESSCFPVADGWANDPASRPEEGRTVLRVRPKNSGYLIRFYMAGMGQAWLDRRRWAVDELRKWGRVLVEEKGTLFAGLFQTQLPARGEYELPALFCETAWNPLRDDDAWAAVQSRIRQLTVSDPVHTGLLSDPPQVEERGGATVRLVKKLRGLDRPDTVEQFHGIRGEVVGDVPTSRMMGDVLMPDSDPAIYTFQVGRPVGCAELTVRGCLDDVGLQEHYEIEIRVNDDSVGRFVPTWPRGEHRGADGFVNAADWSVELPVQPPGEWRLQLILHAPDGWVFYDRVVLSLGM